MQFCNRGCLQLYNLYCVGGDVKHCTIQSNCLRLF